MDPITIVGILSAVHEAVSLLRRFYETVKDAPEGLAVVTSQASVFEEELNQLSSIQHRLPKDGQEYFKKQVNSPECRSTVEELQSLVKQIKPTWDSYFSKSEADRGSEPMRLKEKVNWLRKKDEVKKLADRLSQQADRLRTATATMSLYVESDVCLISRFYFMLTHVQVNT